MPINNDAREIEVRQAHPEDAPAVIRIMDLNGLPRYLAGEERFLLAERAGEILAVLEYRVAGERLALGRLISDPFVEARPLARALYGEARELARRMDLHEVTASDDGYGDFPRHAGYRRRWRGWVAAGKGSEELPAKGLRRILALWGAPQVPFFRGFGS